MKVYRKVDAFRGDAALSSWIYRITFNTAMSRLRTQPPGARADRSATARSRPRRRRQPSARTPRQPADWSRMPDEALLRLQLREAVTAAIEELPEIYRAPVVLRDIEGLTTEEASSRLRVKDQTLKSRLHRGRLMLRRAAAVVHQRPDAASADAGVFLDRPVQAGTSRRRAGRIRPVAASATRSPAAARISPRTRAVGPRRDARGELQRQRGHARGAGRVDLVPVVAGPVIVGVEAGEEVDRGDAVAAGSWSRRCVPRPALRARPRQCPLPLQLQASRPRATAPSRGRCVWTLPFDRPDHVEVEHRDGLVQRDRRVAGVVRGAEQAAFLAGKRDEHQRARKARAIGGGRLRHLDDGRRARRVVVGAVVDLAGALGTSPRTGRRGRHGRSARRSPPPRRRASASLPGRIPTTLRTVRRLRARSSV